MTVEKEGKDIKYRQKGQTEMHGFIFTLHL